MFNKLIQRYFRLPAITFCNYYVFSHNKKREHQIRSYEKADHILNDQLLAYSVAAMNVTDCMI